MIKYALIETIKLVMAALLMIVTSFFIILLSPIAPFLFYLRRKKLERQLVDLQETVANSTSRYYEIINADGVTVGTGHTTGAMLHNTVEESYREITKEEYDNWKWPEEYESSRSSQTL